VGDEREKCKEQNRKSHFGKSLRGGIGKDKKKGEGAINNIRSGLGGGIQREGGSGSGQKLQTEIGWGRGENIKGGRNRKRIPAKKSPLRSKKFLRGSVNPAKKKRRFKERRRGGEKFPGVVKNRVR